MSSYIVRFLRSYEFTEDQWKDYQCKFNSVFKKAVSVEYLKKKYAGSCMGYSFHGVLFCYEQIAGMYTAIPRIYNFFGKETIISQGSDAFILPEHRKDETFLKQIFEIVVLNIKKYNILYHISIPNKIAYPYWINFAGWRDISSLNYFVLPLKVGNLIGRWRFLNYLSFPLFSVLSFIGCFIYRKRSYKKKAIFLKRDPAFFAERFNNEYNIRINSDNSGFVYLNYIENGIKTAYLIDCFPLNRRNIARALFQIITESGKQNDVIIFVGKIETYPFYFIKIPKKKEPRFQPFIGYCLQNEYIDQFLNINNWEISLANFDNR